MIINFNLILLIFATFCATAHAKICVVGVDGCSWTCKKATCTPGQATCDAIPATPKSCMIGSSQTTCGTKCTCRKAETCKVGENGCSWYCERVLPKQATCLGVPGTPETCVVGYSESLCGTTCTCRKI